MTDPAPFLVCPPCDAPISQEFGAMDSGYAHRGRDYACPVGTPIVAGAAGVSVPFLNSWTQWNGAQVRSFGEASCIDFGNGLFGLYAHLSQLVVPIGARVDARTVLGYSGNSGVSTGPHCHQQLCINTSFSTDIADSRDPRAFFIREGDPMTPSETAAFNAVLKRLDVLEAIVIENGFDAICRPGTEDLFPAGTLVVTDPNATGPAVRLVGDAATEYARRRGFSFALAVEQVQKRG